MFGKKKKTCPPACFVIKGFILLILGLLLWKGFLSLEATVAIVMVLAGIKFILLPYCCK